jgi:Mrp family chromosome partitioning ATPase
MATMVVVGLRDRRCRFADDLSLKFGHAAPVIAVVPEMALADVNAQTRLVRHWRSALASSASSASPVLFLASSIGQAGVTTISASLAQSLARSGRRTLLIDADCETRGLTRKLGLECQRGLNESLETGVLNGAVERTDTANLWCMPAGQSHPHLLAPPLASAGKIVSQLRGEFDVIIIDGGSLAGNAHASILKALASRLLLVVPRGQDARDVARALEQLRQADVQECRLIFNRAGKNDDDGARTSARQSLDRHGDPAIDFRAGITQIRSDSERGWSRAA